MKFCPIASGSSGNCIYIGTDEANILIDAGISGVRIAEGLKRINVSPHDIDAVFITHDHSDHIKGAGIFSRRFKTPVYATEGTWRVMSESVGPMDGGNVKVIERERAFKFKDMEIVPFDIPHDAAEPVGFSVFSDGAKVTVATDIGRPSDELAEMLEGCDIVLIEANHDVEMLKAGPYPFYLKKRILGDLGHLSNIAAGELLDSIFSPRLKHVYLGHLSAENNTPMLAYETVTDILKRGGKLSGRCMMRCASRFEVSALAEV